MGPFLLLLERVQFLFQKTLTLNSILHVPKSSCNLISISKLTHDLNCVTKFFPTHCKFQELCTRKTIGCAREVDSLYILDEETKDTRCPSQALQRENSKKNVRKK